MVERRVWSLGFDELKLRDYWRIWVCAITGSLVSIPIWRSAFPNAAGILWPACVTGAAVLVLPSVAWHLCDERRKAKTNKVFLHLVVFIWGMCALVAVFVIAPTLAVEENQRLAFRSLEVRDILQVSVSFDGQERRQIESTDAIVELVAIAKEAELFYPSHEGSARKFEMAFYYRSGAHERFHGRIPERHQNDFSLNFRAGITRSEIRFPGGGRWLNAYAR